MRVPHHEESGLNAPLLAGLTDTSARLYPDSPDAKPALIDYKGQLELICSSINLDQHAYLLDYLIILIEGLEHLTELDRDPSTPEYALLQKVPEILSENLTSPNNKEAIEHLLQLLRDPLWIRPITTDEEKDLLPLFNSDHNNGRQDNSIELDDVLCSINEDNSSYKTIADSEITAIDFVENIDLEVKIDTNAAIPNINSNQQELIDLIRAELTEIIDNLEDLEHDLQDGNHESCKNLLNNMADQAENISNAASLIGLEGLCECGKFISNNIQLFSLTTENYNDNQIFILKQWPVRFSEYLQEINNTRVIAALLELLTNESWSQTLDSTACAQIKYLLENPVFIEDDHENRQVKAADSDVDLTLPDDVNQELLDGLLQDLPAQTEEFSTAIQNIADGGDLDNIDIAQRIAHTLKGAANVVGVNGIANLTHHLEDILEAQTKANTLPSESLVNVLVRASDCLESMAEALLGIDTQPDDAVIILQEVLDWANKLDSESISNSEAVDNLLDAGVHIDTALEAADDIPLKTDTDTETTRKQVQKNVTIENVLRIPVALADDMLRLAGENLIYTSQIQEHIKVLSSKQDALDLHNQSLLQLSYDLEHLIDIQGFMPGDEAKGKDGVFDPLEMDEYHEVHTISRRLIEIAADSAELSQELDKDLSGLKELVVNQNQLHKEGEELVLRTRMVPIKTIIPRLKRGVRQASRLTGKQVELIVQDNNTFMDSEVLNNLIEPIMHILRNAIDHGIENEEDRFAKGKPPGGTINLNFERKGNQILIDIIDDGQGLDTDDIYSKALSTGLITPDDDLTIENIQRLILEPGVTTRKKVTQVSGRGIGLDVVSVKLRELKGSIDINSDIDEGTRFTLSLPISSFSTHSLLVRSRQYIYAISSHGVEEILYPGIGEIRDVGEDVIYQLGQDAYSVVLLDTLLNLPADRRNIERNRRPILLVKDESGTKMAILVQEVIDSRDVVVKNMGSYIPQLKGIIGATVLGDGSVSPVIDLPEMLHERSTLHQDNSYRPMNTVSESQPRNLPYVLVVDDSLSARRSLAQFVEDLGFEVRTARDGMEAIDIIETSKPDLLLVDMEMPKMNGLELTSHVRATPNIKNIPVIMITSRSTDKHRKTAIDKGVNHYMVKPFNEDELAQHINTMLEIA